MSRPTEGDREERRRSTTEPWTGSQSRQILGCLRSIRDARRTEKQSRKNLRRSGDIQREASRVDQGSMRMTEHRPRKEIDYRSQKMGREGLLARPLVVHSPRGKGQVGTIQRHCMSSDSTDACSRNAQENASQRSRVHSCAHRKSYSQLPIRYRR